jgi:hypothetical protein
MKNSDNIGADLGFVLRLQALTAWIKNLYPEDQRRQFEGIRQNRGVTYAA